MAMGLSASVFENCFGEKYITEMQLRIYLAFTEQLMFSQAVRRHLSRVPQGWTCLTCNRATIRRRNWLWFSVFKHNFTNKLLGLHLDDPNVNIFPSGWRNSSPGLQCNGCNIFDLMSLLDMRRSMPLSLCLALTLIEHSPVAYQGLAGLSSHGEDLFLVPSLAQEVDRVSLWALSIIRRVWGSPQLQPSSSFKSKESCLSLLAQ